MRHLLISLFFLSFFTTKALAKPKNVILMIGDGMGEAEISLARNYAYDSGPGLFIDTIDDTASAIVISLRDDDPSKISFVGDSASGGTVLATGELTAVRRISTSAGDGNAIPTILEAAKEKGFATGLVTTAVITDASPAAFASHVQNRYCMKAGDAPCRPGEKPIIDQYLEQGVDVLLGGGQRLLPAKYQDTTIEDFAINQGYEIAKTADATARNVNADKLWGVYTDYHLPREWQGKNGKWAEPLKIDDDGNVIFPEAERCEPNPEFSNTPKLEQMTDWAIEALSSKENDNGFFLMIEGASIDKAAHDADTCGTIGEMLAFDRSIKKAIDFAKADGNTMVIVTADHGGATQNIHHPYYYDYKRTANEHPGLYKMLISNGGSEMVAYYGTNREYDQAHTGINVPVYSFGMPDDLKLKGTIRQTDIKPVIERYLME